MSTKAITQAAISRSLFSFIQRSVLRTLHGVVILALILPNLSVFDARAETAPATGVLEPTPEETTPPVASETPTATVEASQPLTNSVVLTDTLLDTATPEFTPTTTLVATEAILPTPTATPTLTATLVPTPTATPTPVITVTLTPTDSQTLHSQSLHLNPSPLHCLPIQNMSSLAKKSAFLGKSPRLCLKKPSWSSTPPQALPQWIRVWLHSTHSAAPWLYRSQRP